MYSNSQVIGLGAVLKKAPLHLDLDLGLAGEMPFSTFSPASSLLTLTLLSLSLPRFFHSLFFHFLYIFFLKKKEARNPDYII